jgi:hypothetical protein
MHNKIVNCNTMPENGQKRAYKKIIQMSVPCTPLARKYLLYNYGDELIMRNDNVSKILIAGLKRKDTRNDKAINMDIYPYMMPLKINIDWILKAGPHFTPTAIQIFNKNIRDQVIHMMCICTEILRSQNPDITIKEAIKKYLRYIGINEDELSLEAANKAYQRYRKRTKKN